MEPDKQEKTIEAGRLLNDKGELISVVFKQVKWTEIRPEKHDDLPRSIYI